MPGTSNYLSMLKLQGNQSGIKSDKACFYSVGATGNRTDLPTLGFSDAGSQTAFIKELKF